MTYPFTYKVEWDFDGSTELTCGILFADTYRQAAEILGKEFNEDNLISMRLFCLEQCNTLSLPEEFVDEIEKGEI